MFDIGISEIAVIAVVALVVIGPERLPKVARTVGTLLGRAQRYVNDVKAEVSREMELDELRKLQTQMQDAARGIHEQVATAGAEVQSAVAPAATAMSPAEPTPAEIGHPGLKAPLAEPLPEAGSPVAGPATAELPPPADKPAQASLFPEHTVR